MTDENVLKGFERARRADVLEMEGRKYFSTFEAARRLGVCAGTWYALKKRFKLKGSLVGKKKYYSEEELAAVVFNRKFEAVTK